MAVRSPGVSYILLRITGELTHPLKDGIEDFVGGIGLAHLQVVELDTHLHRC